MSKQTAILTVAEGMAVTVENAAGTSPVLLVCEHASLTLPASLGTLGLSAEALTAHIAWDPGALAVARKLSGRFDAALVFQNFSRLVYDCNRPPESPDAMPVVSEIFEIPGNRNIGAGERQDVGTAEREDEEHLDRPATDALDGGELLDELVVGEPLGGASRRDVSFEHAVREVLERRGLRSGQTRGA